MSAPGEPVTPACLNCGSPDPGRYCAACGQRNRPPIRSVWHFLGESFEALTHVDSRLWRTLGSLLARPGFLTREYLIGRQVRYLPPVQLYLVLSVVLFVLVRGLANDRPVMLEVRTGDAAQTGSAERARQVCPQLDYVGPFADQIRPRLVAGCERAALDGGAALQDAFLEHLPRALFILLPILALLMQVMYWRPRHFYVEHLLLLVHNHSAAFAAMALVLAIGTIPGLGAIKGFLAAAVALYLLWYLYRSMRRVYGQGRWRTLGKVTLLGMAYLLIVILVVAGTALVSVTAT